MLAISPGKFFIKSIRHEILLLELLAPVVAFRVLFSQCYTTRLFLLTVYKKAICDKFMKITSELTVKAL